MVDIQSRVDDRGIPLDQVGIAGLRYPIVVQSQAHERQHSVATIAMSVNLPHEAKGTHMSRFLAVLSNHHQNISMQALPVFLKELQAKLDAENTRVEIAFPYFMERIAPVSRARALMDFECRFVGEMRGEVHEAVLEIKVPITSLCPCSQAISKHGAHNQRGTISLEVRAALDKEGHPAQIWIEDLIGVADASASSPVYPLLKREDEKFVTEQAYANPAFVEDIVRNVAVRLQQDPRIAWFRVHVENYESIHNHQAYASREWDRYQKAS